MVHTRGVRKGASGLSPWLKTNKTAALSEAAIFPKGGAIVKGYHVPFGYMGYVPWLKQYLLFATETEYLDYLTS